MKLKLKGPVVALTEPPRACHQSCRDERRPIEGGDREERIRNLVCLNNVASELIYIGDTITLKNPNLKTLQQ